MRRYMLILAGLVVFHAACRNQSSTATNSQSGDSGTAATAALPSLTAPVKLTLTVEPNGVVRLGDRAVRAEQLEEFLTDTLRKIRLAHGRLPDSLLMVPDPKTPRNTLLIINDIVQTATAAAQQDQ